MSTERRGAPQPATAKPTAVKAKPATAVLKAPAPTGKPATAVLKAPAATPAPVPSEGRQARVEGKPATAVVKSPPPAPPPALSEGRQARVEGKPATSKIVKPATSKIVKVSAPSKETTSRRPAPNSKPATGRSAASSGTRTFQRPAAAAPQKNNKALLIGGIAGAVVLIAILAFALSNRNKDTDSKKKTPEKTETNNKSKTNAQLEREGLKDCDEGLQIIQSCKSLYDRTDLTDAEKSELRTKLSKGKKLIDSGNIKLNDASSDANRQQYQEALKSARQKLGELQ